MRSFTLTIFIALLLGILGYIFSSFVVSYLQTDISGATFLLAAVILLPINYLWNILKELGSDSMYSSLRESEKRRLKKVIKSKRHQLYVLAGCLIILSILCVLGFQFAPQYKDKFLFLLTGVTLADIVFVFHVTAINDEINDFKNLLKERQDRNTLKKNVLNKLSSHGNLN